MMKYIVSLIMVLISCSSVAQVNHEKQYKSDSTLMNFIKGIQSVIEKRAKSSNVNVATWPKVVILDSQALHIDSLYKFKIHDVKNVSINFDYPTTYGTLSQWGIITIHMKKE